MMSEFSRPLHIKDIQASESLHKDISANENERQQICERFQFLSLEQLVAHLDVSYDTNLKSYHVKGDFFAKLEQACIVSLEPITEEVRAQIDEILVARQKDFQRMQDTYAGDSVLVLADIQDQKIDLAEIVVQNLSLAVNQFPRKEGTEIPKDYRSETKKNAFSVLEGVFPSHATKE